MTVIHKSLLRMFAGLATVSVLLAACSDDGDSASVFSADEGAPSDTEPDTGDDTEDEAPASTPADGELTPPGTQLSVGDAATIPIEYGDAAGVVAATVVSIEEGDASDLDVFDNAPSGVPYYVTFSYTKVSGGELRHTTLDGDMTALVDGSPIQQFRIIGRFDPCDTDSAPSDFDDDGVSFESCRVFVTSAGSSVEAAFQGGFGSEYRDDPIIWTP